ncbi:MAG: T9SS type A sorting domain-containing protein, partial [Chitinophagales bacterium]
DLTAMNTDTTEWIDPTDTDPIYFFLWLYSDVAERTGAGISNAFVSIEDIYNFYERTSGHLDQVGFGGTISGVSLPVLYDDAERIYQFPMNYNDVVNTFGSFNFTVPGLVTWKEERERTNTVDGWGTITTPYGTFDALRQRSDINIIDTFSYDIFTFPFTYITHEYRWLAPGEGIPVFTVVSQEVLGIETTTQVSYKSEAPLAIQENNPVSLPVYLLSNPVEGDLTFYILQSQGAQYSFSLTDLSGKVVHPETQIPSAAGLQQVVCSTDDFTSGIYLLHVHDDSGNTAQLKCLLLR